MFNLIFAILFGWLAWWNYESAVDPTNPIQWLSWAAVGFCVVMAFVHLGKAVSPDV